MRWWEKVLWILAMAVVCAGNALLFQGGFGPWWVWAIGGVIAMTYQLFIAPRVLARFNRDRKH